MQRFGAPYSGGYYEWPLKWLIPVEMALTVYDNLTAVARALDTMKGEALAKWQSDNKRLLASVEAIQTIRDELEAQEND